MALPAAYEAEHDRYAQEPVDNNAALGWECRVFLVGLIGVIPGAQLGCILAVALLSSSLDFEIIVTACGALGFIAGGMLEADWFV